MRKQAIFLSALADRLDAEGVRATWKKLIASDPERPQRPCTRPLHIADCARGS